MFLGDDSLDIGAYIELVNQIGEELICVLNTMSEILAEDWLRKLAVNLALPNVGLVGATGSHESLNELKKSYALFPNPKYGRRPSRSIVNRFVVLRRSRHP